MLKEYVNTWYTHVIPALGKGTGGADEGVPRSPAGVDPKETPLITKHLAEKLRTRHEQRLVTKRQVD